MAQTPAVRYADGEQIDYTPAGAVNAGDVVLQGNLVGISALDIAANALGALNIRGLFTVPKDTSIFSAGDPVFWNPTGNPVTGVAGSGCATSTSAGTYRMGFATLAQLTGDSYVYVELWPMSTAVGTIPVSTVAAAGSVQGDAVQMNNGFNFVTGADGTKGAILPVGLPGMLVEVKNRDSDNAILKVYPKGAGQINAIAASGAISMAAKTSAIFRCLSATQWYTIPLVPS